MRINCLRWVGLVALSFFVAHGAFLPPRGYAEQRELAADSKIEKIDAMVLLDASGSMLATDPQRLRDEGAKLFFQFLKPGDRLGIVAFSEKVNQIRPLTDYESGQAGQLSTDLAKVGNAGTYTDILGAMKFAQKELKDHAREDAHQIIVILSDGKIDPDPQVSTARIDTDELINTVLPSLKSEGVRVHTLYFSEQADKELLSQIALGSDGVNWFTPNADKIHESYADLFLVAKKPQIVPLAGKAFMIDNDIDEATFYINREEGAIVTLESPTNELMTAATVVDGIKWYSGTKFEVITLEKPKPGKWKITGLANADGFATVLTDLKLITEWPSSFNAQDPVILQARLYEEKKPVTLPQMTGAVKYGFQIIPTDKVSEPILRSFLVDDASEGDKIAEDGIYSKSITIEEPGEYRLTIVAKGPTFTRHQQIPFRVKPRLITLRVSQKEGDVAHGESKVAGHGEHEGSPPVEHSNEHAAEKPVEAHGEALPSGDGHAEKRHDEQSAGIQGSSNDVFEIVLSTDASALKSSEVKLSAVDGERRRFSLPVTKVSAKGEAVTYQAPATLLPKPGGYQLEASISGVNGKKEHVHAESETLQYIKAVSVAAVEEEHTLVVAEKPVEEGFPVIGLLLITILNFMTAGGAIVFLKKTIQSGMISIPEMAPIGPLQAALAGMRERMSLSDLDLNDPRFSGASEEVGAVDLNAKPAAKNENPADTSADLAEPDSGEES